ncbi:GreA/GreB family elongation factor [Flexithrix dorotheae]|uniref:GreA/GreB family elongation factor n=1 Tax=Flexithrix dorotheae TaxID=70993 RepID=UPI0003A2700E|nr:GreA/GreB family elongation factor [Flexithrix dorotheae]
MGNQPIILEKDEYHWILGLLENRKFSDPVNQSCLDSLQKELNYALVKDAEDMPDHIVRLNSIVSVETPYGPKSGLQLVVPSESNIVQDKISVLSPMGSALIGYGIGDQVNWIFPRGKGVIRILDVKNTPKNNLR